VSEITDVHEMLERVSHSPQPHALALFLLAKALNTGEAHTGSAVDVVPASKRPE
jgi:hypothetical protein